MIMTPFMLFAIVAISCGVLSTISSISSVTGFSTVTSTLPALQLRHNNINNNNNQPGYNQHEIVGSDDDRTRTMTVSLQAGIFDFLKDDTNDDDNNDNDTVVEKKKKSTAATKKNSTKNVKPVKAKAKVKAKSLFDKSQQSENSKNYTGIKRS